MTGCSTGVTSMAEVPLPSMQLAHCPRSPPPERSLHRSRSEAGGGRLCKQGEAVKLSPTGKRQIDSGGEGGMPDCLVFTLFDRFHFENDASILNP